MEATLFDELVASLNEAKAIIQGGKTPEYKAISQCIDGIDVVVSFDDETERLFADFYKERDAVIKSKQISDKFLEAAVLLASRGEDVGLIIDKERRQVDRLLLRQRAM